MFFSRQIQQFIAVVRAGSFIRAANDIAITPSALSHGINELEQRLGKNCY
ncbi:LysR family transcriptional regulator [Enterobacter pasteurii]|nr:LysR family transcriptional regulator [Enterobacter pasteurii]